MFKSAEAFILETERKTKEKWAYVGNFGKKGSGKWKRTNIRPI